MVYSYSHTKYAFNVWEDGKDYCVPQIALIDANKSIGEFWDGLIPEEKEVFLVNKNPEELEKMLDAADKVTPPTPDEINSLMKALKMVPPEPKSKPQFASLQEMYDSAQPVKLKKGAAKSLGKTSPGLTFSQYQPLNLEIKNTTSAQDFKIYTTNTQPKTYTFISADELTNWPENSAELGKKAK